MGYPRSFLIVWLAIWSSWNPASQTIMDFSTDVSTYTDTAYSDTPLIVTLKATVSVTTYRYLVLSDTFLSIWVTFTEQEWILFGYWRFQGRFCWPSRPSTAFDSNLQTSERATRRRLYWFLSNLKTNLYLNQFISIRVGLPRQVWSGSGAPLKPLSKVADWDCEAY